MLEFGEARAMERREKAFNETQPVTWGKSEQLAAFEPQKAGPARDSAPVELWKAGAVD